MKQKLRIKFFAIYILCLTLFLPYLSGCHSSVEKSPVQTESETSTSQLVSEAEIFDNYIHKLFLQEVSSNTINLHYTLEDPEALGITDYNISLGNFSQEDTKKSISQLENMKTALDSFDYDALNTRQKLTLTILKDYCSRELEISDLTYYDEPLRPTTGVTSELPVLLAEYSFSRQKDVTDYLTLLGCVETYFDSIMEFEEQKAKRGLFMSDAAADTLIKSCRSFVDSGENNYLISTFDSRIDKLEELSNEKKETYKGQNRTLILEKVIPAYQSLIDGLTGLKGSGNNEEGLCHYTDGKRYYTYLVKSSTGSERSIEELQQLTQDRRNFDINSMQQAIAKNPALLDATSEADVIVESPQSALITLQEKMKKDFPAATNTSFEINYVHESLEDALAPAFYLTAPLDNPDHNVIYINKKSGYEGIQLFTTLAHEGYPGHLYQTTGSHTAGLEPVRSLLNYPGYVEGWATYVEMISYNYLDLKAEISDVLMHNQSALLSLYATVDMGIHYDGWSFEDVRKFFAEYGVEDETTIHNIFELIVEEPAHYLKYYIGYLEFLKLREDIKSAWGNAYTDLRFHKEVVEAGPMPFYILKDYLLNKEIIGK